MAARVNDEVFLPPARLIPFPRACRGQAEQMAGTDGRLSSALTLSKQTSSPSVPNSENVYLLGELSARSRISLFN